MSEPYLKSLETEISIKEENDDHEKVFIDFDMYRQKDFVEIYKMLGEGIPFHEAILLKTHPKQNPNYFYRLIGRYDILNSVNIHGKFYDLQNHVGPDFLEFPKYRVVYRSDGSIIKYSNNLGECEIYFNHLCKVYDVLNKRLSLDYSCEDLSDSFYLLNSSAIKKSSRTRLALIIGNSLYPNDNSMGDVINNAFLFYTALLSSSFQQSNIFLLINTDLRNFMKQWEIFLEKIKSFETYIEVIVYFSGRGESEDGHLNLTMVDGNKVKLSTIASTLTQLINNESLCLFVVDCFRDLGNVHMYTDPIETFDDKKKIAFLFGCKYGESNGLNAGVFTHSLAKIIFERKNSSISDICLFTSHEIKKTYKNYSGYSLIGNIDFSVFKF
ncbi:hypothetical protein ACTA71_003744 [Dictyostelium dimigraforme]